MHVYWMVGAVAVLSAACQPAKPPEVQAPPAAEAPAAASGNIVVELDPDGRVLWNGEEVSLEELERRARAAAGTPTELSFIMNGKKPSFEQAKRVMDVLEPTGLLKNAYVVGGTAQ
jgi:biopolymer transport protein ExbD